MKKNGKAPKLFTILLAAILSAGTAGCANQDASASLPVFSGSKPADTALYVDKVEGIDDTFIRGVDVSSYISLTESGVTYKDWEGNTLDDAGFFALLGEAGINWIRIRIWNNPYDSQGNSYGGGHNDLETALKLGKLATDAGMQVLIDYHYSDFWADPSKQKAPKEWGHYTYEDKCSALETFTRESLTQLLDAGVNVGMVQIGNETVSGLSGETDWERICGLMKLGSRAVRETAAGKDKDILIAMHFTNPHSRQFSDYAAILAENDVDYDVFATSYYPFWHGTAENLTSQLSGIARTYGKKILVAETSYIYTDEDGDGWSNSVNSQDITVDIPYEVSVQGQANAVREVIQAVADVQGKDGEKPGMGVFYWEPAWIPIQVYDASSADAAQVLKSNQEKWESIGSGWASSYAGTYDSNDAGKYYGGSSWDNQAMFDFWGNPLESLNIFKYVYSGTTAPLTVTGVEDIEWEAGVGEEILLPETVPAYLCSGRTMEAPVIWDTEAVEQAREAGGGSYEIQGKAAADGVEYELLCRLEILNVNYIKNPGLEDKDMSMWVIDGKGVDREEDNNKRSGSYSLKFWSDEAVAYTVEQEIMGLEPGVYELGAFLQGGDTGSNALFQLYITVNGETLTTDTQVNGWLNWSEPRIENILIPADASVTVGVKGKAEAKAWGAWDDFYLYKADAE